MCVCVYIYVCVLSECISSSMVCIRDDHGGSGSVIVITFIITTVREPVQPTSRRYK